MNDKTDSVLPRPARVLAGKALQHALNRALALDPAGQKKLAALEGRSVQLRLRGPQLEMRVSVEDGCLRVGPAQERSSLRVVTTPGSVLAIALRGDGHVPPGALEIAGDAGLARQVEHLLQGWSPDLEAAFSGVLGDVIGVPVAQGLERVMQGMRRHSRELREDAAAWVRDEKRLTPSRAEVDDYLDGVDQVRERGDRLLSRLERLERGS